MLDIFGEEVVDLIEMIPIFTSIAASNASEDCLTLNIVRPAGLASDAGVPVMFWIFGGAFLIGGPSQYDGTSIVERSVSMDTPVIFVSVNYRLNSFGFLPGAEVAADSTASVNAGLQDQRLGLEWVQKYISAFGGDPTKVTVFGESAGAISIGFQLLANNGALNGLFRGAIMESGSPIPVDVASRGQHSFDVIASATGCDSASDKIACLRAVSYEDLLAATNLLPNILSYSSISLAFLPRTDGSFLPDLAQNMEAAGSYAKDVAILSGDQYDEGSALALGTLNITSSAELETWLATVWFPNTTPAQRAEILTLYPADVTQGSPFGTSILNVLTPENKRINAIVGDVVFQACRRMFLAQTQLTQPTWSYASRVLEDLPLLGSFHASDILSVFALDPLSPVAEFQSRWIAFANTLNPNAKGYEYWPEYGTNKTLLQFSDTGSSLILDTYREAPIQWWIDNIDSLSL